MLTSIATIEGHTFFHGYFAPGAVVVDLGANRGSFAGAITRLFGVTCYSVEANPALIGSIKASDRVRVFNRAISDSNEPITFHTSDNPELSSLTARVAGASAQSVTVQGQTLASFLNENQIKQVDLMKMDIEGAETRVFASTPDAILNQIAQISIEFHDFVGAYEPAEVDRMVKHLTDRGFRAIQFSRSNMNWLFYRPELCPVGGLRKAWAQTILKPIRQVAHKFDLPLPTRL